MYISLSFSSVQLKYQQNKRFGRNDEISTFKSILDPDVPNGRSLAALAYLLSCGALLGRALGTAVYSVHFWLNHLRGHNLR